MGNWIPYAIAAAGVALVVVNWLVGSVKKHRPQPTEFARIRELWVELARFLAGHGYSTEQLDDVARMIQEVERNASRTQTITFPKKEASEQ